MAEPVPNSGMTQYWHMDALEETSKAAEKCLVWWVVPTSDSYLMSLSFPYILEKFTWLDLPVNYHLIELTSIDIFKLKFPICPEFN